MGGHLFNPTNSQLITLFKNTGLHHLRLGGSTVEGTDAAVPDNAAIDDVFGFAQAAGIKVIYSLRLLMGNPATDAVTAQYIWQRYRPWLACFAIGNEPDIKRYHYPPNGTGPDPLIKDYATYLADWRKFAAAVTNALPDVKFAGPDAANQDWAGRMAKDEKNSGELALVTQHFYIGGSPFVDADKKKTIPAEIAISNMLSAKWVKDKYPALYKKAVAPVVELGFSYRLTEADDYLKGVGHASDAYASALWALDYLHWWAAHGASGVDFHNTEWLKTDTVHPDKDGNFQINPKAYGIKMFDVAAHGKTEPVKISNKKQQNLTAYAIRDTTNLYVTLINKEYGPDARAAVVTIVPEGDQITAASAMFLKAPDGNPEATNGITLGGATITNNAPWQGRWTPLDGVNNNKCSVTVPPASAVIVRM